MTWNIEQVWGSDRFYYEGDVAENQFAFIIDSGIAKLDDLNVNEEWSKSFVEAFPDPFEDITGHGTAVATIIGAKTGGEELTGVAPGAQLVSLRVFGDNGWARWRDINNALAHAKDVIVENNLFDNAVVNLSIGGGRPNRHPLVEEMADLGIKFSIAAGNGGRDVDGTSPASYGDHPNVYTVSAVDQDGNYPWFSNFDGVDVNGEDDVQFAAPGVETPTYNPDGTINERRRGTSFSAPHIGGLLLMSENIRPGEVAKLNEDQIEIGAIADPIGMFDPYTYKHGPSTGEPAPPPPSETIAPTVFIPYVPVDERIKLKGDRFDNILNGADNKDRLRGLKGNDTIFGFESDDVIRGGKGDDYLDGGKGSDFITGGFDLNIFANQRDGEVDILNTRVDKDPTKADVYEGLDYFDKILIQDSDSYQHHLSVRETESGIGIFNRDILEAVYVGGDLTVEQIDDMVISS